MSTRLGGDDLLKELDDSLVKESFEKSANNGSRRVNLGAVVGAVSGGGIGATAGAVAGALGDTYGPKATKALLDAYLAGNSATQAMLSKAATMLSAAKAKGPEAEKLVQYLVNKQYPEIKKIISVAGTSDVPEDFEPKPNRRPDKPLYSH
jgi:hypothetical protein